MRYLNGSRHQSIRHIYRTKLDSQGEKLLSHTAIVPKILHRIPLFAAAVSNRQSHLVIQERAGEGAQQFLHIWGHQIVDLFIVDSKLRPKRIWFLKRFWPLYSLDTLFMACPWCGELPWSAPWKMETCLTWCFLPKATMNADKCVRKTKSASSTISTRELPRPLTIELLMRKKWRISLRNVSCMTRAIEKFCPLPKTAL